MQVLNSSPSRPYIIQVRDDYGMEVGSQICHIVGSDGGVLPRGVSVPSYGLMTDVAYRWCAILQADLQSDLQSDLQTDLALTETCDPHAVHKAA